MLTERHFRLALYTAMFLATLGLWMGEDSPLLPYPWIFLLCAVTAYKFTDQGGKLIIPAALAPWLGAGAFAIFVREEIANFRVDPVLPLGHLIILFQVILLFQPKRHLTDWLLLLTSFLLMWIATLSNNRLFFGVLLVLYLAVASGSLTQFLLVRERQRHHEPVLEPIRKGSLRQAAIGSILSASIVCLMGLAVFLVIPRTGDTAWSQYRFRADQHITGFDERIRLGELGTILESDEEVMVVRMFDENDEPIRPNDEPYWRGITLTHYAEGRWERRVDFEPVTLARAPERPARFIRQEIRLQVVHRDVLFALRPFFNAYARGGEPLHIIGLDGTLVRPEEMPGGPLQYTVESYVDRMRQPQERGASGLIGQCTEMPDDLRVAMREYVAQLNPPSLEPADLCEFLTNHLQDPNHFDYTLRASIDDPTVDPVIDFLLNRKEGHCEYFASALTLMLRAHGVPARVVNGFKGGDWNELFGKSLVVRQKHAHSWVEAAVRQPERNQLQWITLDPTPGPGRQRTVALVNQTPNLFRQMRDTSRQMWSSYVLNFNSSEQQEAIYGPVRAFVVTQSLLVAQWAREQWVRWTRGFNWFAAGVAAAAMAAFLLALRVTVHTIAARAWAPANRQVGSFARIMLAIQQFLSRWLHVPTASRQSVPFYDQFIALLAARGHPKEPSSTPRQFAEQMRSRFEQLSEHTARVAGVPATLVDHYYRVRYGCRELPGHEAAEIDRLLRELASALKS